MARRPEIHAHKDVLRRKDLETLSDSLSRLSVSAVRDFCERPPNQYRISDRDFPSARAIQKLVQACKLLRKWRR